MTPLADRIQKALSATSRQEVLAALRPRRAMTLAPLEISRLAAHLRQLGEPMVPVKLALLRTYTTDLLKTHWPLEGMLNGLDISVYEAPYGVMHEEAGAGVAAAKPDVTCFFLRAEDLHPRLRDPVSSLSEDGPRVAAGRGRGSARRHSQQLSQSERLVAWRRDPLASNARPGAGPVRCDGGRVIE
jgi:hypothetical protein